MPINYKDYHPDWKRISHEIRFVRAGGKCESCGAVHGSTYQAEIEPAGLPLGEAGEALPDRVRSKRVVLTTAHLDHDIQNNDPANLKALCQACHLRHDRGDNLARLKYGKKYSNNPTLF